MTRRALTSPRWLPLALLLAAALVAPGPTMAGPRPVAGEDGGVDIDGDGVDDAIDECVGTEAGDIVDETGCGVTDDCPCEMTADGELWANHGEYVRCVVQAAKVRRTGARSVRRGLKAVKKRARRSTCGQENLTRCCVWEDLDDLAPGKCRKLSVERCELLGGQDDVAAVEDMGPGSCEPNPCE